MKLNVWNLWIISVCAPLTAAVVMAQEAAPATPAKAGKGGLVKVVLLPAVQSGRNLTANGRMFVGAEPTALSRLGEKTSSALGRNGPVALV